MKTLKVPLGNRSYEILIGQGLLGKSELFKTIIGSRAVIVTNSTIGPIYSENLRKQFELDGKDVVTIVLPDGEKYKSWESLNTIYDKLIENRCERSTPLIALGGGVIGDITGFAASSYQRGVPFLQVPTTLLSQVDSSVGGKTAINHPLGKNMIGAFYQPKRVIIDIDTLATLPKREFSAGLAEVIKYGLIRDRDFFEWLEENIEKIICRDKYCLTNAIARSCQNKIDLVVEDETEKGSRALLNLGHTFGHAIEAGMGFGLWLHGEAVAAGTMIAAELSQKIGWITPEELNRIQTLFERVGLPVRSPPEMTPDRYIKLMSNDKKVQDGKLRLVLLTTIGMANIVTDIPNSDIISAISNRTL